MFPRVSTRVCCARSCLDGTNSNRYHDIFMFLNQMLSMFSVLRQLSFLNRRPGLSSMKTFTDWNVDESSHILNEVTGTRSFALRICRKFQCSIYCSHLSNTRSRKNRPITIGYRLCAPTKSPQIHLTSPILGIMNPATRISDCPMG